MRSNTKKSIKLIGKKALAMLLAAGMILTACEWNNIAEALADEVAPDSSYRYEEYVASEETTPVDEVSEYDKYLQEEPGYVFNISFTIKDCPSTATTEEYWLQALKDTSVVAYVTKDVYKHTENYNYLYQNINRKKINNSTNEVVENTFLRRELKSKTLVGDPSDSLDRANVSDTQEYKIGDKVVAGGNTYTVGISVAGTESSVTCTISNIPVWINAGTGDQAQGGDGSFKTNSGFYQVHLPSTIDIYNVSPIQNTVTFTMDSNERKWTGSTGTVSFTKFTGDNICDSQTIDIEWRTNDQTQVNKQLEAFKKADKDAVTWVQYRVFGQGYQKIYRKNLEISQVDIRNWKLTFTDLIKDKFVHGPEYNFDGSFTTANYNSYLMSVPVVSGYNMYFKYKDDSKLYLMDTEAMNWIYAYLPNLEKIVYVEQTNLSGTVEWYEDEIHKQTGTEPTRLSEIANEWITVYDGNAADAIVPTDNYAVNWANTETDVWHYTISGLDRYDASGNPIDYYVILKKTSDTISGASMDFIPSNKGDDSSLKYRITYDNKANSTNTTRGYNDCSIHAALFDLQDSMNTTVQWFDDATGKSESEHPRYLSAMNARKDASSNDKITFYLWRTVDIEGNSAAAVNNPQTASQYTYSFYITEDNATDISDTVNINLATFVGADAKMPWYDDKGNPYTYFYTCSLSEDCGYKVVYANDKKRVYAGDAIKLVRAGNVNITAQKEWKASGQNDYTNKVVQLMLQHSVDQGPWENALSSWVILEKANAAKTVIETVFGAVEQFDENGKVYDFRVIEKMDGVTDLNWDSTYREDGIYTEEFTIGNNSYEAESMLVGTNNADGTYQNGIYTVTNRLKNDIDYRIVANWPQINGNTSFDNRTIEEKLHYIAAINAPENSFEISQNGKKYARVKLETVTDEGAGTLAKLYLYNGSSYVYKKDVTIDFLNPSTFTYNVKIGENVLADGTTEDIFEERSENYYTSWKITGFTVPEYDAEGKRYTYTVTDGNCNGEGAITNPDSENPEIQVNAIYRQTYYENYTDSSVPMAERYEQVRFNHYITSGGTSSTLYISKEWNDNISVYEKRSVEVHIVLIQKQEDGSYKIIEDLGASDPGYRVTLDANNNFQLFKGVTPLTNEQKTADIEYGVIEYAVSNGNKDGIGQKYQSAYNDQISYSGNYTKSGVSYILEGTSLAYFTEEADVSLQVNPYAIKITRTAANVFKITNTIQGMSQIKVQTTWNDANNQSGYRQDKYRVELYREGKEEKLAEQNIDTASENTYDIDFGKYPIYDENGNRYSYYVKQYIVKANGDGTENVSEIKHTDTKITTQNHYTSVREIGPLHSVKESDSFLYEQTFSFVNTASNMNYEADFYVLWHDEDAYRAKARPDMEFVIERAKENGLMEECSGYTAIVKQAIPSATASENGYYQIVSVTGLEQYYDDNGTLKEWKYYLKPHLKTVPQYAYTIDLYNCINKEDYINAENADANGFLTAENIQTHTSYQRKVPEGLDTVTERIPEYGVAVFTLAGNVNISGVKLWKNLTNGMEQSYPYCEVYLYRLSDYDSENQLVKNSNGVADTTKSIDMTTIESERHVSYCFEDSGKNKINYPKYDAYGCAYRYSISEKILTGEHGHEISVEIFGNTTTGLALTNTFDAKKSNRRAVTIEKDWQNAPTTVDSNPPAARFALYRVKADASWYNADATEIAQSVDYSQIDKTIWTAEYLKTQASASTDKVTLINKDIIIAYDKTKTNGKGAATISDLNIYAPDGAPYVYFVVEDTSFVPSYDVTTVQTVSSEANSNARAFASNVILVGNDNVGFAGESGQTEQRVGFINTYREKKFLEIRGTISWGEISNSLNNDELPAFSNVNDIFDVVVVKSAAAQENQSNTDTNEYYTNLAPAGCTINEGIDVSWEEIADTDNKWSYKITLKNDKLFPLCSENGNYYNYSVYCLPKSQSAGITLESKSISPVPCLYGEYVYSNYSRTAVSAGYGLQTASKVTNFAEDASKQYLNVGNVNYPARGRYHVTKQWQDGYDSYGLRPKNITTVLQYRKNGETEWKNVKNKEKTADLSISIDSKGSWQGDFRGFPITYLDSDCLKPYEYRVIEIKLSGADTKVKTNSNGNYDYGVLDNGVATYIEEEKVSFNGTTLSEYPAYKSSQKIGSYYAYQPKEKSTIVSGVIGSEQKGAKASDFNYATTYTINSTIYNVMESNETVALKVTKNWVEPEDAVAIRSSINLIIQKRTKAVAADEEHGIEAKAAGDWETITETADKPYIFNLTGTSTASTWIKTFKNLPRYRISDTGFFEEMEYRAIEVGNIYEGTEQKNVPITSTVAVDGITADSNAIVFSGSAIGDYKGVTGKDATATAYTSMDQVPFSGNGNYVLTGYSCPAGEPHTATKAEPWTYVYKTELTDTMIYKTLSAKKIWNAGSDESGYRSSLSLTTDSFYTIDKNNKTTITPKSFARSVAFDGENHENTIKWRAPIYNDRHEEIVWNVKEAYVAKSALPAGKQQTGTVKYTYEKTVNLDDSEIDIDNPTVLTKKIQVPYTLKGEHSYSSVGYAIDNKYTDDTTDDMTWLVTVNAPTGYNGENAAKAYEEWVVCNTPLIDHRMEADYVQDENAASVPNGFGTRAVQSKLALQYKVAGTSNSWATVEQEASNPFYASLFQEASIPELVSHDSKTYGAAYDYDATYHMLPKYDSSCNKYEYRVIELSEQYVTDGEYHTINYTGTNLDALEIYPENDSAKASQTTLDREVGGYTFTYDNTKTGVTELTKTLLTTTVDGTKNWEDNSDKYNTRPAFDNVVVAQSPAPADGYYEQAAKTDAQPIRVDVTDVKASTMVDYKLFWKSGTGVDKDKWFYKTTILPKYTPTKDVPAEYVVTETMASAIKDYAKEIDDDKRTLTNTLGMTDITVKKVWADDTACTKLGFEQKSVTYTVQRASSAGVASVEANATNLTFEDLKDATDTTVTITLLKSGAVVDGTSKVTTGTLDKLPTKDGSGNAYYYRAIESEMVLSYKTGESTYVDVTYSLNATGDKYQVKQVVRSNETVISEFAKSTLSGNGSYSYEFGPLKATYAKSTTSGATTFSYINTPIYASATNTIAWQEVKGGAEAGAASTNDATLVKNFRPNSVTYVLQRKLAGEATWSTISSATIAQEGISYVSVPVTEVATSLNTTRAMSTMKATELPVFAVTGTSGSEDVKAYEYRIVEEKFAYSEGQLTEKTLLYNVTGYPTNTIAFDFIATEGTDKGKLFCQDTATYNTSENKTFYRGTQTNAALANHAFKTTIINKLLVDEIPEQVYTKLTGTITWHDNHDELKRRPDADGIAILLRAQLVGETAVALTTSEATEFVIGADGAGSPVTSGTFTIPLTAGSQNVTATVSWVKNDNSASTSDDTWTYEISGLPVYDKNGNYITYSIAHKEKAHSTYYEGQAIATNVTTEHKADSDKKYAYGTVIDVRNDYSVGTGKLVYNVDFEEDIFTTFTITKNWVDADNHYTTRPEALTLLIQNREVQINGSGDYDIKEAYVSNVYDAAQWSEAFAEASYNTYKSNPSTYAGAAVYKTIAVADFDKTIENVWSYKLKLPQYDREGGTYKLLQYRASEIGMQKSAGEEHWKLMDKTVIPTAAVTDTDVHSGSYYVSSYESKWDRGASEVCITNTLDRREDITVKKEWNISDAEEPISATVTLRGTIHNGDEIDYTTNYTDTLTQDTKSKYDIPWSVTYQHLPKYDKDFNLIEWSVIEEEVTTTAGTSYFYTTEDSKKSYQTTTFAADNKEVKDVVSYSTDNKWMAKYSYNELTMDGAHDDELFISVINTPLTSAKLTVEYEEDLDDYYNTRFANATAVLQYRSKADAGVWTNVSSTDITDTDLAQAVYKSMMTVVGAWSDGQLKKQYTGTADAETGALSASYAYESINLPKYVRVSNDTGSYDTTEVEYRIVELSQKDGSNLLTYAYSNTDEDKAADAIDITLVENAAGDRTSGGYALAYSLASGASQQSDLVLTKTFLTTTIAGKKTWVDASNHYQTRPGFATLFETATNPYDSTYQGYKQIKAATKTAEDATEKIAVKIKDNGAVLEKQPDIFWHEGTVENDDFDLWYYATGLMPKYSAHTNGLAAYTVAEESTDAQYEVSYDANGTDLTNTRIIALFDITKKDATSKAALQDATFTIYRVIQNADGSYTRVNWDGSSPAAGSEPESIDQGTTDSNGKLTLSVMLSSEPRTFEIVETTVPVGYRDDGSYPYREYITLDSEHDRNTTKERVIENTRTLGTLTIQKQDGDTHQDLNDVVFELYRKNESDSQYAVVRVLENIWNLITGKKYTYAGSATAGTDGKVVITDIPWGEYYLIETQTLAGYHYESTKYYFTVDRTTVGSPLELETRATDDGAGTSVSGNIIANYKNAIKFQKRSVEGADNVLTGGVYEIYRVNADSSKTKVSYLINNTSSATAVSEFTVESGTTETTIYGLAAGNYEVVETTAPAGYKLDTTPIPFTITSEGRLSMNGSVVEDSTVVMKNMPLCSLEVTKNFEDLAWKDTVRPDKIWIQLYQYKTTDPGTLTEVGTPKEISISKTADSYSATYTDLPMFKSDDNGASYYRVAYIAKEIKVTYGTTDAAVDYGIADTVYTVANPVAVTTPETALAPGVNYAWNTTGSGQYEAGGKYQEIITNTFVGEPTTKLYIKKLGPTAISFTVKVSIGKNSSHLIPDAFVTIKGDENKEVTLPAGVYYHVEEVFPEDAPMPYQPSYYYYGQTTNGDATTLSAVTIGNLIAGNLQGTSYVEQQTQTATLSAGQHYSEYVVIRNEQSIYTAIENDTTNEKADENTVQHKTDAGGKVGLILKPISANHVTLENSASDSIKTDNSGVEYHEGKYGVYWKPEKDWATKDSFSIAYVEFATADGVAPVNGTITVSNYLDTQGNPVFKTIQEYFDGATYEVKAEYKAEDGEPVWTKLSDYLDESGKLQSIYQGVTTVSDPYAELAVRYPNFEIRMTNDGYIVLYLANDITGMPYLNDVIVEFVPTVAVINTTERRAGGKVSMTGFDTMHPYSDGIGENNGDARYPDKTVIYAEAEPGYCIDLSDLEVGLVGKIEKPEIPVEPSDDPENQDPEGEEGGDGDPLGARIFAPEVVFAADDEPEIGVLSLNAGRQFSTNLYYKMIEDESVAPYTISGQVYVERTDSYGNPTRVRIEIDNLKIPIDFGIPFIISVPHYTPGTSDDGKGTSGGEAEPSITTSTLLDATLADGANAEGTGVTEENTNILNQKNPKTGDTNDVWGYLGMLIAGFAFMGLASVRRKRR